MLQRYEDRQGWMTDCSHHGTSRSYWCKLYFSQMNKKALPLSSYKEQISSSLLAKAKKFTVRECDEEEKGRFIAYVDEGDLTRDVSLTINAQGEVTDHTCDCQIGGKLCMHIAALIIYVTNKKVSTKTRGRKAVKAPFETALEEVTDTDLRAWLLEILRNNKDLQLNFLSRFTKSVQTFTPDAVILLTLQGRKAIIKSKKKADTSELKRMISLWEQLHAPVIESYLNDPTSATGYEAFYTIIKSVGINMLDVNATVNRVDQFIGHVTGKLFDVLRITGDEKVWKASTGFLIRSIEREMTILAHMMLNRLYKFFTELSPDRKADLARQLLEKYAKVKSFRDKSEYKSRSLIIQMADESKLFKDYAVAFPAITYENEYNTALVMAMINAEMYDEAEDLCREQIDKNVEAKYDLPYEMLLRELYRKSGDDVMYLIMSKELFSYTFDYDDYLLFLKEDPDEASQKEVRENAIEHAREGIIDNNTKANLFLYTLLESTGDAQEMILQYSTLPNCYPEWCHCFQKMFEKDPGGLLSGLLNKRDYGDHGTMKIWREHQYKAIVQLRQLIMQHYEEKTWKAAINAARKKPIVAYSNKLLMYMTSGILD